MSIPQASPEEGVVVIRVWHNDGAFRARVTFQADDTAPQVLTVTSPDRVVQEVRLWLAGLSGQ